ncbi:ELMO/CED-12 family-domain-containing protein [Chytriomyces cf. hyalinus JEL632]|nr:ELMO/CED-12 family-domain-containing protein [Chytriomyces cf. hyalinus JEL632]
MSFWMIDGGTKHALRIMSVICSSSILLYLYKKTKAVVRYFSHTSELLRIVSIYSKPLTATDSAYVPSAHRLLYRIDQSLLYSKMLLVERRYIESDQKNTSDAYIKRILAKKLFREISPEATLLKQSIKIISNSFKLLHKLNELAATKYDTNSKTHEKMLTDFWECAMPHEQLFQRNSKQWQFLGFQGDDPATDFRGMGILGLENLIYYARTHPDSFQRVLANSHHPKAWFSMAIVGINISSFVLSMHRQRLLQKFFYKYGVSKDIYHELYCFIFDSFESRWTSQNESLTVMDFERFFKQFRVEFEARIVSDEIHSGEVFVLDEGSSVLSYNRKIGEGIVGQGMASGSGKRAAVDSSPSTEHAKKD